MNANDLRCDSCGRPASAEHIARRLQRLEWTSRYRPVHIGTLLLAAVSPRENADFLYCPEGKFAGEAGAVLDAAGVSAQGKSAEAALSEFQRGGFLLAHVMECPLEENNSDMLRELLESLLPAAVTRIRRSLKPKRVALISEQLAFAIGRLQHEGLSSTLVLDGDKAFGLDGAASKGAIERLRRAISVASAVAR